MRGGGSVKLGVQLQGLQTPGTTQGVDRIKCRELDLADVSPAIMGPPPVDTPVPAQADRTSEAHSSTADRDFISAYPGNSRTVFIETGWKVQTQLCVTQ